MCVKRTTNMYTLCTVCVYTMQADSLWIVGKLAENDSRQRKIAAFSVCKTFRECVQLSSRYIHYRKSLKLESRVIPSITHHLISLPFPFTCVVGIYSFLDTHRSTSQYMFTKPIWLSLSYSKVHTRQHITAVYRLSFKKKSWGRCLF